MAQAITLEIDESSFEDVKDKMLELYQIADSISAKMENAPVKSVEVIKVEDGDVLAVMVKGLSVMVKDLSAPEALERIKKTMTESFLPKKVSVVVMNAETVGLKIIRAE